MRRSEGCAAETALNLAQIASATIPSLRLLCTCTGVDDIRDKGQWWRIIHRGAERHLEELPWKTGNRIMKFVENEASFEDACCIHGEPFPGPNEACDAPPLNSPSTEIFPA